MKNLFDQQPSFYIWTWFFLRCVIQAHDVRCSDPPDGRQAILFSVSFNVSGEAVYNCSSNHSLARGSLTLTCDEDGLWNGLEPWCISSAESHTVEAKVVGISIGVMVFIFLIVLPLDFILYRNRKARMREARTRERITFEANRPLPFKHKTYSTVVMMATLSAFAHNYTVSDKALNSAHWGRGRPRIPALPNRYKRGFVESSHKKRQNSITNRQIAPLAEENDNESRDTTRQRSQLYDDFFTTSDDAPSLRKPNPANHDIVNGNNNFSQADDYRSNNVYYTPTKNEHLSSTPKFTKHTYDSKPHIIGSTHSQNEFLNINDTNDSVIQVGGTIEGRGNISNNDFSYIVNQPINSDSYERNRDQCYTNPMYNYTELTME